MKAIVLYRSVSGFTEKYARWIAEDLKADLFNCRDVKPQMLSDYDVVIFGGSLHKGGINGIDIIKRNYEELKGKRIIIFVTGGSRGGDGMVEKIERANFSADQRAYLRLFYFRGGFNIAKLGIVDKVQMMIKAWRLRQRNAGDLTPDETDLLAACKVAADGTDRNAIRPLVDHALS
jgi:menaquinone-dependent protoporphyrinogen IX oxidase